MARMHPPDLDGDTEVTGLSAFEESFELLHHGLEALAEVDFDDLARRAAAVEDELELLSRGRT